MVSLKRPLTVGLTGGIGCGKTTVAHLFSKKHITVIDTDELAREVVVTGSYGYQQIIAHFGNDILYEDRQINRAALKDKIFADAKARQWLEALLHPLILTLMRKRMSAASSPYCIVVIPLLVETQMEKEVDRILVIDLDEKTQMARVQQRDGLTPHQVQAILNAQASREDRLNVADDILLNTGNVHLLKNEVDKLHQLYLQLAAEKKLKPSLG